MTTWDLFIMLTISQEQQRGRGHHWNQLVNYEQWQLQRSQLQGAMQQFNQRFIYGVSICIWLYNLNEG